MHAESWRSAYRGLLPDAYLDGPIFEERRALWVARMRAPGADRRLVLKAVQGGMLLGFACVLLDAEPSWGALLDNLHVKPTLKRQGIGRQLFDRARHWIQATAPRTSMHLTVIEENVDARRFYERIGGKVVEQMRKEVIEGVEVSVLRYRWDPLEANFHPRPLV